MYKLTHSRGEILVEVSTAINVYEARIKDSQSQIDIVILGEDMNDLYYKCLGWASTNIHGEFSLESLIVPEQLSGAAA